MAYEKHGLFDDAIFHAKRRVDHSGRYDLGAALISVANLHDKLGQQQDALKVRKEAVVVLRKELQPVPVGIFGPLMAADLLEALNKIPSATIAEKQAAADIALNHKVQPPSVLRRIRAAIEANK